MDPQSEYFEEQTGDLRRLAFHLVRDAHVAEDLVQEAWFATTQRHVSTLADARQWLRGVVRNLSAQHRRRAERRRVAERLGADPERARDPGYEAERRSAAETLRACLEQLDEPYRSVLRMRYLEEREIGDIARLLDRPASTVRSQIHRGLALLRDHLDHSDRSGRLGWSALFVRGFGLPEEGAPGATRPNAAPRAPAWRGLKTAPRAAVGAVLGVGALVVVLLSMPNLGAREDVAIARADVPVHDVNAAPIGAARAGDREQLSVPAAPPPSAPAQIAAPLRAIDALVVDEAGLPVPDVRLDIGVAPSWLPRATTGPDGRARVEVLETDLGGSRDPEWSDYVTLIAFGRGRALSNEVHVRLRDPGIVPVRIELHTQLALVRGILREQGTRLPVADASVRFRLNGAQSWTVEDGIALAGALIATSTDANGNFQASVPRGTVELCVLVADVKRFSTKIDTATQPVHDLELNLSRAGELAGRVHGTDGSPVGGARIRWQPNPAEVLETTAEQDGSYRLRGIQVGRWRFVAQSAREPELTTEAEIEIQADAVVEWTPQLERRDGIELLLVDLLGHPLVGWFALVVPQYSGASWRARVLSDSQGRIRVFDQPAGELTVYLLQNPTTEPMPRLVLRGVRASPEERRIVIDPSDRTGGTIAGTVLDHQGVPIPSAALVVQNVVHPVVARARLGALDGAFRTSFLPAGTYHLEIEVGTRGCAMFGPYTVEPGRDLELGELRCGRPGRLSIDWRWPAEKFYEYWLERIWDSGEFQRLRIQVERSGAPPPPSRDLLPGAYLLRVKLRDGTVHERAVIVESEAESRLVAGPDPLVVPRVILVQAGPDARLSVLDAQGVSVETRDPAAGAQGVRESWFELAPGRWTFVASDGAGRNAQAEVELDPRRPIGTVRLELR